MRRTVYTGVFACTLVFALVVTAKADAATTNTIKINDTGTQIEVLPVIESDVLFAEDILADKSLAENDEQDGNKPKILTHTTVESDTLSKIAETYQTTWKKLYDKNPQIVDPNIINPGDIITIPTADEVLLPRELPFASTSQTNTKNYASNAQHQKNQPSSSGSNSSSGNRYTAGYCTWYVKNRRPELPNNLGNASSWYANAAAQGMSVGTTPQVGAAGQRGNHVVYVESVNADGTVTISEMNHKGLYVITSRTLPADYFVYIY